MPKVGMEEIRRKQVIEATIRCIQEGGIEHLTMKVIAEEAKVSTGIIYHYFENKNQLLLTVLKHVFSKSNIDVMELVEPIKSPKKKMLKHIERMLIVSKENEQFYHILMAYYGQALNNVGVKKIMNKFNSNLLNYICTYLKDGIVKEQLPVKEVETFAFILLSVALGSGIMLTTNPKINDLNKTIELFQEIIKVYLKDT